MVLYSRCCSAWDSPPACATAPLSDSSLHAMSSHTSGHALPSRQGHALAVSVRKFSLVPATVASASAHLLLHSLTRASWAHTHPRPSPWEAVGRWAHGRRRAGGRGWEAEGGGTRAGGRGRVGGGGQVGMWEVAGRWARMGGRGWWHVGGRQGAGGWAQPVVWPGAGWAVARGWEAER